MSPLDTLLAAINAAPALPGARCRGKHHLFDGGTSDEHRDVAAARHAQALTLCEHCPALQRCTEWHDSLPRTRRPAGVVAGRINHANRKRIDGQIA